MIFNATDRIPKITANACFGYDWGMGRPRPVVPLRKALEYSHLWTARGISLDRLRSATRMLPRLDSWNSPPHWWKGSQLSLRRVGLCVLKAEVLASFAL